MELFTEAGKCMLLLDKEKLMVVVQKLTVIQ